MLRAEDGAPWPSDQTEPPDGYALYATGLDGADPVSNALAQYVRKYAAQATARRFHATTPPFVLLKPSNGDKMHRLCLLMYATTPCLLCAPSKSAISAAPPSLLRNADGWRAIQEAAMAVDDEALEASEVELAPGDVKWTADLGRFKARIEQLCMGDVKRLPGLIPLLPNPKSPDFDVVVRHAFEAFASTWRQHAPLLPSRADAETTDAEPESESDARPPKRLRTEANSAAPALAPALALPAPSDAAPSTVDGGSDGGGGAAGTAAAARKRAGRRGSGSDGGGKKARAASATVQEQRLPASGEQTDGTDASLSTLVQQLQGVLAAKPLDEAAVDAEI